ALAVALTIIYEGNRSVAFQEWYQMSPFLAAVSILMYVEILYAPGYILNRTVLRKFSLTFGEKVVFYPVFGCIILGFLNLIETYYTIGILNPLMFIILLNGLVIALFLHDYKYKKTIGRPRFSKNWFEILGVVLAIIFIMFIFLSAVSSDIFLRGDMWADANRVAFINKY